MKFPKLTIALLLVAMMVWVGTVVANNSGLAGKSTSTQGCNCHGNTPNVNAVVSVMLTGPNHAGPSSTSNYTLAVSDGSTDTTGGFDMSSTGGTFVPGSNSKLLTSDLVHAKNKWRSWSFGWTAPATEGTQSFFTIAMTSNGGGASGDSWNWYGDAVSTPFNIQVSNTVGVDDPSPTSSLSPASPNPFSGITRMSFTTPRDGVARLDVVDLQGRRVATLVQGSIPAGLHQLVWYGRGDDGHTARGGAYFIRLQSAGTTLVRRVMKLD